MPDPKDRTPHRWPRVLGGLPAVPRLHPSRHPFTIRLLGPSRYGLFRRCCRTSVTLAVLTDVGMASASTKFGADPYACGEDLGGIFSCLGCADDNWYQRYLPRGHRRNLCPASSPTCCTYAARCPAPALWLLGLSAAHLSSKPWRPPKHLSRGSPAVAPVHHDY
jgi:hypothetical protein